MPAADTVAANGLHGALLVGKRQEIAPRKANWVSELATFKAELYCDGQLSRHGGGVAVLGSPLLALRHLVELLRDNHDQQITFKFAKSGVMTHETMVFNRKDLVESTAKILEENGIRFPYSPDLKPIWEKAALPADKISQGG